MQKPEIDSELREGGRVQAQGERDASVEFHNVDFSYLSRKDVPVRACFWPFHHQTQSQVLRDVPFELESGKTVALVGHSGCGKSTIVNLLLRFYNIDNGQMS